MKIARFAKAANIVIMVAFEFGCPSNFSKHAIKVNRQEETKNLYLNFLILLFINQVVRIVEDRCIFTNNFIYYQQRK